MLKNIKRKDSGFTLVELLIVIVIIAILAVLTLVGVSGYINRANDSKAKDSAGQLRTKIEAWNAIKSSYPAVSDVTGGLSDPTVPEAALNSSQTSLIASDASTLSANTPLLWAPCTASGGTGNTGGTITYWQTNKGTGYPTISLGSC